MALFKRITVAAFLALCALLLLGPLIALIVDLIRHREFATGDFSAADRSRLIGLLFATLRLTAGATILATALGVIVAIGVHRSRGILRRVLSAAFPTPLLISPSIVAIAWTHLIGKRGILTQVWTEYSAQPLPFSIYGEWGSAFVLALCWFPLVTFSTLLGLRACQNSVGAAGRVYAGASLRFWKIDVPLMAPYVAAGAAIVAWLALGDFEVPSVFLSNAFPVEIYSALQVQPDRGRALLLCLPLLGLAAVVLVARAWLAGRSIPTLDSRWVAVPVQREAKHSKKWPLAAAFILFVAVILPIISLLHQSRAPVVFQNALQTARKEILHSFATAFSAGVLLLALGIPYARMLAASRGRRRAYLTALALAPLMIPGTMHGLAWIGALSGFALGRAVLAFPWLMAFVHAAHFFPLGVFLIAAAFEGLDERLTLAARSFGAGRWLRWKNILLPLLHPGLLAAFAICFAFSLSEVGSAILLNPIGYSTLPVRVSSLLHFGKDDLLAALCVIQALMALIPWQAASLLLERSLEVRLG